MTDYEDLFWKLAAAVVSDEHMGDVCNTVYYYAKLAGHPIDDTLEIDTPYDLYRTIAISHGFWSPGEEQDWLEWKDEE